MFLRFALAAFLVLFPGTTAARIIYAQIGFLDVFIQRFDLWCGPTIRILIVNTSVLIAHESLSTVVPEFIVRRPKYFLDVLPVAVKALLGP